MVRSTEQLLCTRLHASAGTRPVPTVGSYRLRPLIGQQASPGWSASVIRDLTLSAPDCASLHPGYDALRIPLESGRMAHTGPSADSDERFVAAVEAIYGTAL